MHHADVCSHALVSRQASGRETQALQQPRQPCAGLPSWSSQIYSSGVCSCWTHGTSEQPVTGPRGDLWEGEGVLVAVTHQDSSRNTHPTPHSSDCLTCLLCVQVAEVCLQSCPV